ncbi:unnamed protein product [Phytophthora lilii]|uniref:Unnamed protein product n=1 Tax=Phytophthora lilii TaxID=2077276 RepID=A0A9W6X339_9STRA|nr:unnamed protein product [Phytophthora lilii]
MWAHDFTLQYSSELSRQRSTIMIYHGSGNASFSKRCNMLPDSRITSRLVPSAPAPFQWLTTSDIFLRLKRSDIWIRPWLGWAFVYTFVLFIFSFYRILFIHDLIALYATPKDGTFGVLAGALCLGFLEDLVCATFFACALWLFDTFKRIVNNWVLGSGAGKSFRWHHRNCLTLPTINSLTTFVVSWMLYVAMTAPFIADLLIVRIKGMRFTFELISMAIEERKYLSASPISREEVNEGYKAAAMLVFIAIIFASVRVQASWADLAGWNPTKELARTILSHVGDRRHLNMKTNKSRTKVLNNHSATEPASVGFGLNDDDIDKSNADTDIECASIYNQDDEALLYSSRKPTTESTLFYQRAGLQMTAITCALLAFPAIVIALSCASPPLIAYSALNASLNEFLSHALEPTVEVVAASKGTESNPWVETFIHTATEKHILFGPNSLYRRTTGFEGDLEFNVKVAADNPPNVLVIAVESFRFHDSHYLVGEEDPSNLFKGTNITVTPNFDRWAKRGIALRNFWSSIRTSRALESLLFAQIPYDSAVNTGTTGGKRDTKLAGLPQLFTAKGYETFFTTGSTTDYDNWDIFLPTHGFDTVWNNRKFSKMAESDLGITRDQWFGPEGRGHNWGVHDDVSFQLLGDLLVNKTKDQRDRMANGDDKTPLFLTHFTISSHGPFIERPQWYAESEKPDFSALYEGEENAERLKNYLEMRYFTDMELGKFMDRMSAEGILNDTIVVITGDHGGSMKGEEVSGLRVAGAIIAEGRIGDAVGLVFDDAAEHYDILNTLADITGVPEGGFLQNGVGRSLKRKVPFGERVVFSNDPNRKMSIVRGHKRMQYDRVGPSVLLHDAYTDHAMTTDLFPDLTGEEQEEWISWRDNGRRIASYYTKRWDEKCLLAVDC